MTEKNLEELVTVPENICTVMVSFDPTMGQLTKMSQ